MNLSESYKSVIRNKVRFTNWLLFSCIIIITLICYYNSAILNDERLRRYLEHTSIISENQLIRYESFQKHDATFYGNIIATIILSDQPYLFNLANDSKDIVYYSPIDLSISEFPNSTAALVIQKSKLYGRDIVGILSDSNIINKKDSLIAIAASKQLFNKDCISIIKNDVLYILLDSNFKLQEDNFYYWVVFGEFPKAETAPGIDLRASYTNKYDYYNFKVASENDWNIFTELRLTNYTNGDSIFFNNWKEANEKLKSFSYNFPKFSLLSTGLNVATDKILMFFAPLIIFLQIIFYLFWKKEKTLSNSVDIERPYLFPEFSHGMAKTFERFLEKSLWLLFLVLPSLILIFGFITRYDISSLTYPSEYGSSIMMEIFLKQSNDLFSYIIDYINLECFFVSLIIIISMTRNEKKLKFLFVSAILILVAALTALLYNVTNISKFPYPPDFRFWIKQAIFFSQSVFIVFFARRCNSKVGIVLLQTIMLIYILFLFK